jgi:hypothetical protein
VKYVITLLVLQNFTIKWEGRKEIIEFEDDLTFGEMESILAESVDLSDVTKPRVNLPAYRQAILLKTLRKAPFKVNDISVLKELRSSVVNNVLRGVLKSFPLSKFLEQWMGSFIGDVSDLKIEESTTTSSQGNSAGQKKK